MPNHWLDDLAVVGNPEQCAAQIQRLLDAGADSVALFPIASDQLLKNIKFAADEIFPYFHR